MSYTEVAYAESPYAASPDSASSPSITAPLIPDLQIMFSPSTGPYATPSWVDITAYVRQRTSIVIRRGRDHALDDTIAGSLTLELDNSGRVFDPLYSAGPYYGMLGPNKQIQVRATWSGVTYYLFTGLVDGLEQRYDRSDNDATVMVRASDVFRLLARRDFRPANTWTLDRSDGSSRLDDGRQLADNRPSLDVQRAGDRIGQIAATVGITSTQIDTGASALHADVPEDDNVLDYFRRCARTDLGFVFVAGDGTLTFHDRHRSRTDSSGATSQLTVGDTTSHTVRYHDIRFDPADERVMVNHARCGRSGTKPAVAKDRTSVSDHGEQVSDRSDLLFASRRDAGDQAKYLVDRYGSPRPRVASVTLVPRRHTSAWSSVLGFELGTRVTVERWPLGVGSTFSQESLIESVEHRIDLNRIDWRTTWALSAADTGSYFRLDRSDGTSRLDNNVTIGY